jgi:hypothetical protein
VNAAQGKLQTGLTIVGHVHRKMLLFKYPFNQPGQALIIFNQ